MFPYGTSSKNKTMLAPNPKGTKVPPELIEHFKNTAEIPKRSFKENQNPRETVNIHPDIKIQQKPSGPRVDDFDKAGKVVKSQIVEGDFSKIANSYVLEGNVLKKQEVYEEVLKQEKKKAAQKNKENLENSKTFDRKEILKLEYLEKMGFLRPDEKEALAQFRKFYPEQFTNESTAKKPTNAAVPKQAEPSSFLPYYSPKGMDPKTLNQFFSPNSKYAPHGHMGYY